MAVRNLTGRTVVFGGVEIPPSQHAPPADDFTREEIAKMDKADLLDMLETHGWTGDKRLGVDKLRAELIAIMFVGE